MSSLTSVRVANQESCPSAEDCVAMGVKWKKSYLVLIGVFLVVAIVYLVSDKSANQLLPETLRFNDWSEDHSVRRYNIWPVFQSKSQMKTNYFSQRCAYQKDFSVTGLVEMQADWSKSRDSLCRELYKKFHSIFSIDIRFATVKIPEPFKVKVRRWLGNDKNLFNEVYNQSVINIVNHLTHEHTVFNPIRDKRPVSKPEVPEDKYFREILDQTAKTCDFCNYKNFTAEDTFGRVDTPFAFTASNIFKLDPLHALVIAKQHDPIHFTIERFIGMMQVSVDWTLKAHHHYPQAKFAAFIWDVLPKCGASQVHPHIQAILDHTRYHGEVEVWREAGQDYHREFGGNYFSDLVTLYSVLNLTARYGNAVAFANLVPRKDHEVVIMSESPDKDFFKLIFFVLRAFIDDLGKNCYSMGLGYPGLDAPEGKIPAYARVITRGVVSEIRSDISSFEMFLATNVNIDPYKTINYVRDSIQKRK